jgi:hypothetical protein
MHDPRKNKDSSNSVLSTANQSGIPNLQKTTISTTHGIEGQLHGLILAIDTLQLADKSEDNKEIMKLLEGHERVLECCKQEGERIAEAFGNKGTGRFIGSLKSTNGEIEVFGNFGDVKAASQSAVHVGTVQVSEITYRW